MQGLFSVSLLRLIATNDLAMKTCNLKFFRIPKPQFPQVQLVGSVLVQSLFVAIVGYSVVISLGQTFAEKGGYKIDSNQVVCVLRDCFLETQRASSGCKVERSSNQSCEFAIIFDRVQV